MGDTFDRRGFLKILGLIIAVVSAEFARQDIPGLGAAVRAQNTPGEGEEAINLENLQDKTIILPPGVKYVTLKNCHNVNVSLSPMTGEARLDRLELDGCTGCFIGRGNAPLYTGTLQLYNSRDNTFHSPVVLTGDPPLSDDPREQSAVHIDQHSHDNYLDRVIRFTAAASGHEAAIEIAGDGNTIGQVHIDVGNPRTLPSRSDGGKTWLYSTGVRLSGNNNQIGLPYVHYNTGRSDITDNFGQPQRNQQTRHSTIAFCEVGMVVTGSGNTVYDTGIQNFERGMVVDTAHNPLLRLRMHDVYIGFEIVVSEHAPFFQNDEHTIQYGEASSPGETSPDDSPAHAALVMRGQGQVLLIPTHLRLNANHTLYTDPNGFLNFEKGPTIFLEKPASFRVGGLAGRGDIKMNTHAENGIGAMIMEKENGTQQVYYDPGRFESAAAPKREREI